jgi:hypothetical protein
MSLWMSTIGTNVSRVWSLTTFKSTWLTRVVMRACEGCRRRKIKCDSATTNTWPCAACVRLKLTCIPPTLNDTSDPPIPGEIVFEVPKSKTFPTNAPSSVSEFQPQPLQHQYSLQTTMQPDVANIYSDVPVYQNADYLNSPSGTELPAFHVMTPTSVSVEQKDHAIYSPPIPQSAISEQSWISESNVTDLASALGDLQINVNAWGMFVSLKRHC